MNKSEAYHKRMTEDSVSKIIISLGIPTTISMLITNIYNMADTYFVGTLGNSASGAVGVVFGLMAIIQAFGFMFGHGAGSIIARKLGQKDAHSASVFASISIISCLIVGTLLGVLGLLFTKPLMRLLGSTETILPYAKDYGIYILIAAPFTMASFALNNILRYEGKALFAMIGLGIGGTEAGKLGLALLIHRGNLRQHTGKKCIVSQRVPAGADLNAPIPAGAEDLV